MNFMDKIEDQEIQVELKYCERCGVLWLRPQGTDGVHCASCHLRLFARPNPGQAQPRKARRRKPRGRGADFQRTDVQSEKPHSAARIGCLQAVATTEVRA